MEAFEIKNTKQMIPINFEGARVIKKPDSMNDEECSSIYAMPLEVTYEDEKGNKHPGMAWVECWQPNKEDIEAINAGRPLWIRIHSIGLPPIAMFTLDEDNKVNA